MLSTFYLSYLVFLRLFFHQHTCGCVLTVLTHFHSVSSDVLTKTRMTTPIIPFRLTDEGQYIGRRGNVDIFTPIWQPQSLSRIYRRVSRNWNTKKSELCYIRLWLGWEGEGEKQN
jgi:hypothetical protein